MSDYTDLEKLSGLVIKLDYEDVIKEGCKELSKRITEKALGEFEGRTSYAKSWTWRLEKDKDDQNYGIVYNEDHYRLTHLLEHGHVIKNGKNGNVEYGRVAPREHIKPAFDSYQKIYVDMAKKKTKYEIKEKE